MQKILSLSEQEAQELQNSNLESLDGFAFSPINSWTREIWIFFHKSEIGDTDTLKLMFFAFSNNTFHPYFLLNFLFIKYRKYPTKIPKRILQTQWITHSIPDKKYMVLLRYFPIKISLFRWLQYSLKPMEQRFNISQPAFLFSLFQEPSFITKLYKKSLRSTPRRILRTWTSVTSPKTRH